MGCPPSLPALLHGSCMEVDVSLISCGSPVCNGRTGGTGCIFLSNRCEWCFPQSPGWFGYCRTPALLGHLDGARLRKSAWTPSQTLPASLQLPVSSFSPWLSQNFCPLTILRHFFTPLLAGSCSAP